MTARTHRRLHNDELARMMKAKGITPVIIGAEADAACARGIADAAAGALDLTGRTGLADIYALARLFKSSGRRI